MKREAWVELDEIPRLPGWPSKTWTCPHCEEVFTDVAHEWRPVVIKCADLPNVAVHLPCVDGFIVRCVKDRLAS